MLKQVSLDDKLTSIQKRSSTLFQVLSYEKKFLSIYNPLRGSSFNNLQIHSKRNFWNVTLTSTHTSAIGALDSLIKSHEQCEVCIVFVSKSYTTEEIELIPDYLYSRLRPKFLSGCVVDKIYDGSNVSHGISLFLGGLGHNTSVRMENKNIKEQCGKFRYNGFIVEGPRSKYKTNSVGRWTNIDELKGEISEIPNGWYDISKFRSVSSAPKVFNLPKELKGLKDNDISPDLFFLISDSEPYQFLESLDYHFPHSKKIGIVGESTPFITGRPYSLFHNDKVLSKGIMGVAFTSETPTTSRILADHPSLCSIGDPLRITSCRGNIILELDGLNPTELLLRHFKSDGDQEKTLMLSKDTEFYLGLYGDGNERTALHDSPVAIGKILSGDPAKGNMAIDTTKDLKDGQYVKTCFFLTASDKNDMDFNAADAPPVIELDVKGKKIFGATSGNGIIIGKGGGEDKNGESWVCDIPYSSVSLSTLQSLDGSKDLN
ncbi:1045_t:CDS:2 [Acaulospora morrowiae]|uniref:1045_t:CDS:1 n=1 Tax=Acaulospora morrowiae TaxID=94023 RepID=A0A9N9FEH4_9GLOM|nr:1045_t:CDS:2 [Acaulospora morrowiae]